MKKSWIVFYFGQPFIDFHLDPPLISLFHLPITTHHISSL